MTFDRRLKHKDLNQGLGYRSYFILASPCAFCTQKSLQPSQQLFPLCVPSSQMNLLLKEYLISGDVSEAEHCLRDLEVPHFHHELVYEVRRM